MGNKESKKQVKQVLENFPDGFQCLGPASNPKYGSGVVYRHSSAKLIFEKMIIAQQIQVWENMMNLEHQNIVNCLGFKVINELCAESSWFGYFDYLPSSLFNDLQHKKQINQQYKESEIWYIIYSIVRGGNYLNENGKDIEELTLQSVMLNQDQDIKILAQGESIINKFWKQEYKYIDPTIKNMIDGNRIPEEAIKENNIFCLCIIILELMTLNVLALHVFIQVRDIKEILKKCMQYSMSLLSFIRILILPFDSRPTFQDLYKILSVYRTQILSFQPFQLQKEDLYQIDFIKNYYQSNPKISQSSSSEHQQRLSVSPQKLMQTPSFHRPQQSKQIYSQTQFNNSQSGRPQVQQNQPQRLQSQEIRQNYQMQNHQQNPLFNPQNQQYQSRPPENPYRSRPNPNRSVSPQLNRQFTTPRFQQKPLGQGEHQRYNLVDNKYDPIQAQGNDFHYQGISSNEEIINKRFQRTMTKKEKVMKRQ